MLPNVGVVPLNMADDPGILALERMASSVGIIDKTACWDHVAMFEVRDALCDRATRAQPAPAHQAFNGRTAQDDELLDAVMRDTATGVGYRLERLFKVLSAVEGRASRAAPVQQQEAAVDPLSDLRNAVEFLDQMRAAAEAGEDVTGTGIAKDARNWLERAARAAIKPWPVTAVAAPASVQGEAG